MKKYEKLSWGRSTTQETIYHHRNFSYLFISLTESHLLSKCTLLFLSLLKNIQKQTTTLIFLLSLKTKQFTNPRVDRKLHLASPHKHNLQATSFRVAIIAMKQIFPLLERQGDGTIIIIDSEDSCTLLNQQLFGLIPHLRYSWTIHKRFTALLLFGQVGWEEQPSLLSLSQTVKAPR